MFLFQRFTSAVFGWKWAVLVSNTGEEIVALRREGPLGTFALPLGTFVPDYRVYLHERGYVSGPAADYIYGWLPLDTRLNMEREGR